MRTVIVHTPKGGAGKSTLTRELAVCLTQRHQRVFIADRDPQATTALWWQRREAAAPHLVKVDSDFREFKRTNDADWLFVDTPGGRESLDYCDPDLVIIPVRPTPDDLSSALEAVTDVAGRDWFFVLTQAPPRARLTNEAARVLASHGRLAPINIGFRVDYPTAGADGRAAVEFPTTKAAKEIEALADYMIKMTKQEK